MTTSAKTSTQTSAKRREKLTAKLAATIDQWAEAVDGSEIHHEIARGSYMAYPDRPVEINLDALAAIVLDHLDAEER